MILTHMLIPSSFVGTFTSIGTDWLFFQCPTHAILMHLTSLTQETKQNPFEPISYSSNIQLRLKSHKQQVIPQFSRHMHKYLSINL